MSHDISSQMDLVEDLDQDNPIPNDNHRPHKLDYYSIPVFIVELLVVLGVAAAGYYAHFEYKHDVLLSGFYCDDFSLRHQFHESAFTRQFTKADNELIILALLLATPVVLIIFCELVNSMFGSVRFRKIRAICTCCKLHSITRRVVRFSGAYILGFFIVVISCNILQDTSGQLKPYFVQECAGVYRECLLPDESASVRTRDLSKQPDSLMSSATDETATRIDEQPVRPLSPPISSQTTTTTPSNSSFITVPTSAALVSDSSRVDSVLAQQRSPRAVGRDLLERKWIDLTDTNLSKVCGFEGDHVQTRKFNQLARSWPSFPAAIVSYTCLFVACYLSYIGTARPFRAITCVIVTCLFVVATIFDAQLVREHYNHRDDVIAGAVLALFVVAFMLIVYLNKFRDTHYYEKQKMAKQASEMRGGLGGYNNDAGQYSFGKNEEPDVGQMQNGDLGGSMSNNDIAMRYFQIPRANYRGAPRPLSSANRS